MKTTQRPRGFDATALQVRRAYEAHFGERIPGPMTYADAGNALCRALGHAEARRYIQGQPNDPSLPCPSDTVR